MKAAQNFFEGRTRFVTDWAKKTSLTKLVQKRSVLKQSLPNSQHKVLQTTQYEAYIEAAQNFIEGRTRFVTDLAQKTSLTKLVLKCLVPKQSLPNSQHQVLQTSVYEAYIEAVQNFIEGVQDLSQIGHKKLPSLNWI